MTHQCSYKIKLLAVMLIIWCMGQIYFSWYTTIILQQHEQHQKASDGVIINTVPKAKNKKDSEQSNESELVDEGLTTQGTKNKSTSSTISNSDDATVMAMATGYDLYTYKLFVESLRTIAGYMGNIILIVGPDIEPEAKEYLESKDVVIKYTQKANCTHPTTGNKLEMKDASELDDHEEERLTCLHPYPQLKQRWARFPLLRDYLTECTKCTGPVLVTDFRDTYFQRDPFKGQRIEGLQVFEEHKSMTTDNWLVSHIASMCKEERVEGYPMLCSGTTIGTREAMIEYLNIMYEEMMVWMNDEKCCCIDINGDDQTIHNWLFYKTDKMKHLAKAIENRRGIVNTVGVEGSIILNKWHKDQKDAGVDEDEIPHAPFPGSGNYPNWIGSHYNLTNEEGLFTNFDGSPSNVVHQYDRFGWPFDEWIDRFVLNGEWYGLD